MGARESYHCCCRCNAYMGGGFSHIWTGVHGRESEDQVILINASEGSALFYFYSSCIYSDCEDDGS